MTSCWFCQSKTKTPSCSREIRGLFGAETFCARPRDGHGKYDHCGIHYCSEWRPDNDSHEGNE